MSNREVERLDRRRSHTLRAKKPLSRVGREALPRERPLPQPGRGSLRKGAAFSRARFSLYEERLRKGLCSCERCCLELRAAQARRPYSPLRETTVSPCNRLCQQRGWQHPQGPGIESPGARVWAASPPPKRSRRAWGESGADRVPPLSAFKGTERWRLALHWEV